MQEGVKVIQRVGKAVAKKRMDMKTVLPKMPPRRASVEVLIFARVGRIIIEDARIFTRTGTTIGPGGNTSTTTASTDGSAKQQPQHPQHQSQQTEGKPKDSTASKNGNAMSSHGLGAKWNKPIGISEIVLRSSELCPPNSLLDENGLPAIYQPVDKILDVIMKRALVGLAKSNTTRFLQTALGEFLELEYSTLFGDSDGAGGSGSNAGVSEPIV